MRRTEVGLKVKDIEIGELRIREGRDVAVLEAPLRCASLSLDLYYTVPSVHADWLTVDRSDGFVVGLLLQAMALNENIQVAAPMSSRLFHSLQGFFIPMMSRAFPNLHPIRIFPSSLIDGPAPGKGVATGFSGGIDSFASVVQHRAQEESQSHKVSHFLFHNAGSHSTGDHDAARRLFLQRYETLKPFAEEVGIPFVPVDSNVGEVFPVDFIRMHPALNVSIPLVLQNQFQRYYYASTYKYADCGVNRTDDIARFDPLAFHLFSTEGLDCVSTGSQMSRVEKTALVAEFEPSRRYLNVCVDPTFEGRNCSVCFKCCRTLMTLELLGEADAYANVFDLNKFRTVKSKYVRKMLFYKRGSFEAEIAELIRRGDRGTMAQAFRLRGMWDRLFWK